MSASAPDEATLYPLFLKLRGRAVLVVGGGQVAERKVASLLESGATVRLVAPEATPALRRLAAEGRLEWHARGFDDRDIDGAWLAIAATDIAELQARVANAGAVRSTFVVAVDDPDHASAYGGAVIRRPPFLVAISSSGATPALSRLLREIIEEVLPGDDWIARARDLRARWKADGTPMGERFADLVRDFKSRG
jgi:uroporphyrin-III C-methyltransferase/precorrin-2 dehydrogenase/sirohydrochlorin ferrochelatase